MEKKKRENMEMMEKIIDKKIIMYFCLFVYLFIYFFVNKQIIADKSNKISPPYTPLDILNGTKTHNKEVQS